MKKNMLLAVLSVALLAGSATLSLAAKKNDKAAPAVAPPAGQQPAFTITSDTELAGADLIEKDIKPGFSVSGVDQCKQACAAAARCQGFTFAPGKQVVEKGAKGKKNQQPACWLKASISKKVSNPGMTSGVKQQAAASSTAAGTKKR